MKIRTKDIEGAYGGKSRTEISLTEPAPLPQMGSPSGSPLLFLPGLAYPHASDGGPLLITPDQSHTQY